MEKSKMGVDNVDMILENAAQCVSNDFSNPVASDPVLEAAKSLLASMSQSTAEITSAMKPFKTPEKSWSYKIKREETHPVKNGIDQTIKLGGRNSDNNKSYSGVKKSLPRALNMMSVPRQTPFTIRQISGIPKSNFFPPIARDEITLTLDPVVEPPTKSAPYSKSYGNNSVHAKAESKDFALQKIQDWHARHLKKLLIGTALDAASKKFKTLSGVERPHHDYARTKSQQQKSTLGGVSTKVGSEQRQNCFTVSHRYYRYLNQPKRAKHDSFQVIFRACVLIDTQADRPNDNILYPTTFIKWPSGKIPLPGYKPISEFRKRIQKNMALKKKRRTLNTYRIAKPKLKYNPLLFKHFSQNIQKKPLWVSRKPLQRKEYLPVKWDSVAKRFTLQTNKSIVRPASNTNWFSYPTTQSKSNTDVLKRFGTSGTVISTSRLNHRPLLQYKAVPPAVKLQQNKKVVNDIFKCTTIPDPNWFKSYRDYTEMTLLYRVRKRMAAIAMKFSYVEGKVNPTSLSPESELQEGKKPVKQVSNTHILISTQTEVNLSSWSLCLPCAKDVDKLHNSALANSKPYPSNSVSSSWLHICKSGFVEDIPKNLLPAEPSKDDLPSLEAQKAWLYGSSKDNMLGMALNSDEQSYSIPSHTGAKSFPNGVSKTISGNCYHKYPAGGQMPRKQRSLSDVRTLQKEKCNIKKDAKYIPRPSYCVRYRMCFCTFDCICPGRFDAVTNALPNHDRDSKKSSDNLKSKISSRKTNGIHPETKENSYDFSEESTVPSILLKSPDSKSLRRTGRTRSESLLLDKDQRVLNKWNNGFCADPSNSEQDASERCTSDDLRRRDMRPTKHIGDTEIMHLFSVKRKGTESESLSKRDTVAEIHSLPERVSAEKVHQEQCINKANQNSFNCSANADLTVLKYAEANVKQKINCEPTFSATNNCLYFAGKKLFSQMCRSEFHISVEQTRISNPKDITMRALYLTESDNDQSSRHLCDLIGGEDSMRLPSEQLRLNGVPDNASNKVACEAVVMGSHLPKFVGKANGNRQASAVQETSGNMRRYGRKRKRRGGKVGGVKPQVTQRFDAHHNVVNGVNSPEAVAVESGSPVDTVDKDKLSPAVKKIQVHTVEDILPDVKIDDLDSSDNGTGNDNASDGRVSPKQLRNRKLRNYVVNRKAKETCENTTERPTEEKKTDNNVVLASGNIEPDSPSVETRSSRRLRSRGNNKRGRYEADYVSDFLKTNKKPKKVLPTRDYDNNDFWQFYRDQEKTLRVRTLARQQKYIRLLRSKGGVATETMPTGSQFSNVVCSSTSVPSSGREPITVPEDGLMPFVQRLTKKRKTFPELPKVQDGHCAYCGRSFVDQDKKIFEEHLARHGMRYTVLTAPQPPRKKKKFNTARKDVTLRKTKTTGRKSITSASPNKADLSYNSRNNFAKCSLPSSHNSDQLGNLKPFPRPAHLSMGHRKQTARKSFSITSSLPKDILIAALECNMRAQSGRPPDITQPTNSVVLNRPHVGDVIAKSPNSKRPVYVTKPYTARKTLTGLPITYNHLSNRLMQSFSEPYQ